MIHIHRPSQEPPSGVLETIIAMAFALPKMHRSISFSRPPKLKTFSQYKVFVALAAVLVLFILLSSDDVLFGLRAPRPACDGRRVFIYDLPSDFNDRIGVDCQNWTFPYWAMCDDIRNDGFGELMRLEASSDAAASLLQPPSAWYKTDQFSLEVIFHRRLKTHPCVTEDPALASMFYLPYYVALDLTRHLFNNDLAIRDNLTDRFVAWLRDQEPWQRHGGRRHVLTIGRIIWDVYRLPGSDWGSTLLARPELKRVVKLLIERAPWQNTTVAVPYPTNFHPSSEAELRSWQAAVRDTKRTQFVSFAGSPRGPRQANTTGTVRDELFSQCAGSPKCKHVVCTQKLCAANAQTIYKLSLESVFCLQPPGDSPTRKGIFDALLSGCVPVLFGRDQAVEQYLFHLPGNGSRYSVRVDGDAVVRDHYDVVAHLQRIPRTEVRRLQESIVQLLPSLLFRNPTLDGKYSSKDAFDVTMDSLFERFDREERSPASS